jgi:hypothetical protein
MPTEIPKAPSPMANKLTFPPNTPVLLKLADPSGEWDDEVKVGRYVTTDGQTLTLPRGAVVKLNELDPAAGEEIGICHYTGKRAAWAVWLSASSEKSRAIEEIDHSELASELQASIEQAESRKPASGPVTPIRKAPAKQDNQPRLFDQRGTGTDGPAPMPRVAALRKGVPYRNMLQCIVRTVKSVLETEKLQLGDDPTQKIIVTLYIDAAKRCGVEYDFREAE